MATAKTKTTKRLPSSGAAVRSSGKGLRKGAESLTFVLIAAGVLILANILGYFFLGGIGRFDFTHNRAYTLSDGSRRLVSHLEDDMQITAYFTADLPPPLNETERQVRDLLAEYEAASGGHVNLRFVNPDEEAERTEAEQNGVHEEQLGVMGRGSLNVRMGFRGIVITYLGEHKTLGNVQTTEGLEYQITSAIQQLVREPLAIGVVTGHEMPTPTKGLGSLRAAMPSYQLREVNAANEIDYELRALLIVGPQDRMSDTELRRINQFVMRGGSLGIFGGAEKIDLESFSADTVDSGVNDLLSHWGVHVGSNVVADAHARPFPLPGTPFPVPYPIWANVTLTQEAQQHPVTFRLPQIAVFAPSAITTTDVFNQMHGVVLARSSAQSWTLAGDHIGIQQRSGNEWRTAIMSMGQHAEGPHNLMVALSGRLPTAFPATASSAEGTPNIEAPSVAEHEVRVLVAGTSTLVRDELLGTEEQRHGQMNSNLALVLNAMDWLAQDADLIAIGAKNMDEPALNVPSNIAGAAEQARQAEEHAEETGDDTAVRAARDNLEHEIEAWDSRKLVYQLLLVLGLPILVTLFGLLRWQLRRNKRASLEQLRMQLVNKRDTARAAKRTR